jgi:signal transduction histidine kinase
VNPSLDRRTLRFIEDIRNEVKTPIAVIKGYTELMESMELDGAQLTHFLSLMRENIELLEMSAEKIRAMEGIEETLAWSVTTPQPQ